MKNATCLPNDLLEVLMSDAMNDTERRVLLFLARKIYGWNKKTDLISNSQLEKGLNLCHSTVSITLTRLKLVGIIELVKPGISKRSPSEWRINTNNLEAKLVGIAKLVRYNREKLVGITIHTKDIYTKDIRNEVLTAFNSLAPATPPQLYQVSADLNIALRAVNKKHAEILELVDSGEMKQKYPKNKTTYFTLRDWLRLDLKRGYLREMSETERMMNDYEEPERKAKLDLAIENERKEGSL